jgi:hypothetical protein
MITKGAYMNYLEIAGDKYSSDELTDIAAARLCEIGVNSFQSIQVNTLDNILAIAFDNEQDVQVAKAIAGSESNSKGNVFQSLNAAAFILDLYTTSNQPGFC